MQKDDNLLKTKRMLKPKYDLSGGLVLHVAGQWSQIAPHPSLSYSTSTNTLNIN